MKAKRLTALFSAIVIVAATAGCAAAPAQQAPAASEAVDTQEAAAENGADAQETAEAEEIDTSISGTITFVSGNDTTGATEQIIAAFEEKYPNVKVELQEIAGASDDIKQGLLTSLAAGDSDPDVFTCDIIWVSQFAAAGWLLDVSDRLEAKSDEFLGGPLSTCYYGDKAYAYPYRTDVGLLFYRSDLIDTPPATWDELVELSKEHIGKDGIENGYVFQMFQGEPTSCNILEFIKQNGGHDLQDGKFDFDNEYTRESLDFVRSLIDEGISPEGVLTHKPDDSRLIFESGNTLFMRNWTGSIVTVNNPETSKVAGNVGITTLPVGPNGTESSGTLGGWDYAINANTDNPEASIAFAEFLSGYEAQKIATLVGGTISANKAVYDDAEVQEQYAILNEVAKAADEAKPRPQVRDYSAVSSIIQVWIHKALTGEADYDEALSSLDEELNAALEAMK